MFIVDQFFKLVRIVVKTCLLLINSLNWLELLLKHVYRPASADAILSSGKQIIVSLGHVGACTLKHERSEP
jgi:hypothetical protein